jgi:predicted hydrocarbon binding protein
MHGTIFVELEKYVTSKLGAEAWTTLKEQAGVQRDHYEALEIYPDAEVGALVQTASTITGLPAQTLLEDFGAFIAPDLLEMYWAVVRPEWRTLDLLENTETAIHEVVRISQKGATPPYLRAQRTAPNEVTIIYTSPRKLCAIAKGIVRGVANHYGETFSIKETTCMLQGGSQCTLQVQTG